MTDRLIPLDSVLNLRDFGGYPTADGRRIVRGRLYRSAHHGRATPTDLEALAALELSVIVDLRRAHERQREPSRRPAGFNAQVIDNDIGDDADDPWLAFMRDWDLSVEPLQGYLADYYRQAPFEPRHVDLYARYFHALGQTDGAVLIHCAAGKDRTGLLAALTHHLLGVSREDLVSDYLLTNTALDFERRLPQMTRDLSDHAGRELSAAATRAAMGVDAAYLDTAIAAIEAAHGDLDGYLHDVLGVAPALKDRVRARLLV